LVSLLPTSPRCVRLRPVRNGAGAAAIRCRYSLVLSSRKQVQRVSVIAGEIQQAAFGGAMRLDRAVVQDGADGKAARGERTRSEFTSTQS